MAARPGRQGAAQTVPRTRRADILVVNRNAQSITADALAAYSRDALQQRDACREVTPLGEQSAQFGRRLNRDPLANMQASLATDGVEPGGDRGGRIPHGEARDWHGQCRERCATYDGCKYHAAPLHGRSALRWSQAWCRAGV